MPPYHSSGLCWRVFQKLCQLSSRSEPIKLTLYGKRQFDFEFQKRGRRSCGKGEALLGEDGVLPLLMKEFLESKMGPQHIHASGEPSNLLRGDLGLSMTFVHDLKSGP